MHFTIYFLCKFSREDTTNSVSRQRYTAFTQPTKNNPLRVCVQILSMVNVVKHGESCLIHYVSASLVQEKARWPHG